MTREGRERTADGTVTHRCLKERKKERKKKEREKERRGSQGMREHKHTKYTYYVQCVCFLMLKRGIKIILYIKETLNRTLNNTCMAVTESRIAK